MARLKIKRDDLIEALTFRFSVTDSAFYLDTETGEILLFGEGAEEEAPEDIEDNPRYIRIEPIESHDAFRTMADFVDTISDAKAAARLSRALGGTKPFRRFKDTLFDFPELRAAWFEFERIAQERLAQSWCEENNIEAGWD